MVVATHQRATQLSPAVCPPCRPRGCSRRTLSAREIRQAVAGASRPPRHPLPRQGSPPRCGRVQFRAVRGGGGGGGGGGCALAEIHHA